MAKNIVTIYGDASTLAIGGGYGLKVNVDILIEAGTCNIMTAVGVTSSHYDPDSTVDDASTKGIKTDGGDTEGIGGNIVIKGSTFNTF